jgi:hypothetical protein
MQTAEMTTARIDIIAAASFPIFRIDLSRATVLESRSSDIPSQRFHDLTYYRSTCVPCSDGIVNASFLSTDVSFFSLSCNWRARCATRPRGDQFCLDKAIRKFYRSIGPLPLTDTGSGIGDGPRFLRSETANHVRANVVA